ncbi:hypothetical protein EVAR_52595_1 [Eumeta japonica]|uniref:Uncharacterized protein n=1 Tax=Eumeta variegata TaxID=151549 RepID=A0A4C1YR58_EUMVA|nr:hypothetical protein EVAR_52595_1 [Eumeta japonica]
MHRRGGHLRLDTVVVEEADYVGGYDLACGDKKYLTRLTRLSSKLTMEAPSAHPHPRSLSYCGAVHCSVFGRDGRARTARHLRGRLARACGCRGGSGPPFRDVRVYSVDSVVVGYSKKSDLAVKPV